MDYLALKNWQIIGARAASWVWSQLIIQVDDGMDANLSQETYCMGAAM